MTADGGLYAAWAAANAEIANPNKDGKGNYGAYLTLDALLDTLRPIYARHGLVWWQTVASREGQLGITTHLAHRGGERLSFGTMYGPVGANVQQMGSVRTYLSRYSYLTAMGIAGGEDDDAALASIAASAKPKAKQPPARTSASTETVTVKRGEPEDPNAPTAAQMRMLGALMREAGLSDRDDVLAYVSGVIGRDITSRNELTRTETGAVIDALTAQTTSTPQESE